MRISHYKNDLALRSLDFLCANWGGQEFIGRDVFICYYFFSFRKLKGAQPYSPQINFKRNTT